MGQYVELKYSKCLVVLDMQDIKKHMPRELWVEGVKRGKGFKRTNESYERKGNSAKQNPRYSEKVGNVGVSDAAKSGEGEFI